ncbi:MAG TPA: HAMP domain-containing sensor histidine kinase [Methanospirillum sp.]|uniref:sensor histidine kinase n=1 Tax=Methanospirillum sp. TaxID=45200 RepID=UPI002BA957EC|nr:HAMP domain-containing sensor histidine kinase [Methanospirillum sp.]HOJ96245.1 HAMP domain-containing sensor histidine kinase [Methanospirillum sp.]HOL40904.1 HAMP domain-containing sensor histidine kinase [Methanospirillum sp.]HPP77262.1 HAMP domain-containing sensor histidine kinase [Methanospirillum sp.]
MNGSIGKYTSDPFIAGKICEYILEKSQVFFLILDQAGIIHAANTYAQDLLHQDPAGVHLKDILLIGSWNDSLLSDWADGTIYPIMNIQTPDDLPRTFSIVVYRSDSGYLLFGHTDSEELQKLSKEVITLNREMGILTRELQVRNRELVGLNAMKNQFLGMAAHDLRSPVSIILNYTEFLIEDLQESLSEEHRQYLENILTSARDMRQVISDFLDISIIESGHLILNREPVSYEQLIQELLRKTRLFADRRKIRITWKTDGNIPFLYVDAGKIGQVLVNLVHNAIEYSPDQGEIEIDAHKTERGIEILVIDHGTGISQEKMKMVFSEFSGTSRRKKNGERSIGLGLVISRMIVEAHGGFMVVHSSPDVGSTFGFILPESSVCKNTGESERRMQTGKV